MVYAYAINDAGRIRQVSVGGTLKASYLYDHKSRLSVRQTVNMAPSGTTHLVYDHRDQVIAEMNPATGEAVREYLWIDDLPVAVLVSD